MRLTAPKSTARFGDIEIRGLQQVLELEAHDTRQSLGQANNQAKNNCDQDESYDGTQAVYSADLQAIQERTAIVVPCKDEAIDRMRAVWAAIPASSLIIVVSGSKAEAYIEERNTFKTFCAVTRRNGMCIHQRDPQVASALCHVGMGALLDDEGLVRKGKGEGMVIGTMLAATARAPARRNGTVAFRESDKNCEWEADDDNIEMEDTVTTTGTTRCDDSCLCVATHGSTQHACRTMETARTVCCTSSVEAHSRQDLIKLPGYYCYIGFIDADNYVPGSVQEYCKAFSAGLALADAEDAMVRINWAAKPKVQDGRLEFKPSGRSSRIVNRWLNRLFREVGARVMGDDVVREDIDEDDIYEAESKRETDHLCTGNAGEHAMSISLALKLRLATGYAIEPFHFLDMFERLAGDTGTSSNPCQDNVTQVDSGYMEPSTPASMSPVCSPLLLSPIRPSESDITKNKEPPSSGLATSLDQVTSYSEDQSPLRSPISLRPVDEAANSNITHITPPGPCVSEALPSSEIEPAKVQILQVRTLNPHFHDNKGEVHVVRMWQQGLSAIYHSPLTANLTKYRNDLRTAIFSGDSVCKMSTDLPTPPATNCASVAVTPPDLPVEEEDRSINGAAVEAAASWQPEKCRIYPAPGSVDLLAFRDRLEMSHGSFWWIGQAKGGHGRGSQALGPAE